MFAPVAFRCVAFGGFVAKSKFVYSGTHASENSSNYLQTPQSVASVLARTPTLSISLCVCVSKRLLIENMATPTHIEQHTEHEISVGVVVVVAVGVCAAGGDDMWFGVS